MDNEDENSLAEFDLSTWDAPAPPAGLADAVIARAVQPAGAPPIEPSERPRRWWIVTAAGALAASAAVVALIVVRGAHHAGADHGEVVATRPQHLDLDTIAADLDAGATVTWKRDRDGLVAQQRGTVTWRVADDDKLRIDTGATLASVEATGASLRVEAHMNLADARVLGAVALTAATVAFVTVVVYEGHVRAGSGGQTVNVEPGTTVEVRPNQPPAPPDLVGGTDERVRDLQAQLKQAEDENATLRQEAIGGDPSLFFHCDVADADKGRTFMSGGKFAAALAGFESSLACKPNDPPVEKLAAMAACQVPDLPKAKLHFAELSRDEQSLVLPICLSQRIDPRPAVASGMALAPCDEVTCVLNNYTGACCAQFARDRASGVPHATGPGIDLDRAEISRGVGDVKDRVASCGDSSTARGIVKVHIKVNPDGHVGNVTIPATPDQALGNCVAAEMQKATFAKTQNGGSFTYPFVFDGSSAAACDAAELAEKGKQNISVSAFAAALRSFEASLRCKPDPNVVKLAFMAACRGSDVAKAKAYYVQLPPASQSTMIAMCTSNRIDPRPDVTPSQAAAGCNPLDTRTGCAGAPAVPACDAADLADKGKANVGVGAYAAALSFFEASLTCKPDPKLVELAFMAACRGSNLPKARVYWIKLTPAEQSSLVQLCLSNKIDPTRFDPVPANASRGSDEVGHLQLLVKPAAKILIDGVDAGPTTPNGDDTIPLAPGKHRITFVLGRERFTYPITIKAGETVKWSKVLQ